MEMYFKQPANEWEETIPIGNGSLGGMIWGKVTEEIIGLNDELFWSGYPKFKGNPKAKQTLEKIRDELLKGNNYEAEELVAKGMLSEYTESYLNLGNLKITTNHQEFTNYRRSLNIDRSLASVQYDTGGSSHFREFFSSYPDKSIFGTFTQEETFNIEFSFETPFLHTIEIQKNTIKVKVKAPEHVYPSYLNVDNPIIQGEKGGEFFYELIINKTDGRIESTDSSIKIYNAKTVEMLFRKCSNYPLHNYERAKDKHVSDYQHIFNKVELDLGEQIDLPIDKRIERLRRGEKDNGLIALYFQYGRYLLISSSRKGNLPANLQGIWNWKERPPWSSNWTTNINLQMNYWGASVCNLMECFEPYINFVKQVIGNGKKTAKEFYGLNGSVCHHNVDRWFSTNPVGKTQQEACGNRESVSWAMWPMAAVWLTADLYRYYEYTNDKEYLKNTVYPNLREVTLFLTEFLVEVDGVYHTLPSTSPENKFFDKNGKICSVDISTTMDITLIKENFWYFKKTCALLDISDELIKVVDEIEPKLAEVPIGSKGQILEWQKEYEEVEPGHRHFSHLYGVYPGEIFGKHRRDSVLKSINLRLSHGGGHTGWSNAWLINLFAVLGEADRAYEQIIQGITVASYGNLWSKHPPFQIDGNLGGIAGIASLFVQDRNEEIKILPALPKEIPNGYVKGLRVKGNKIVEIKWKNGEVIFSSITKDTEEEINSK